MSNTKKKKSTVKAVAKIPPPPKEMPSIVDVDIHVFCRRQYLRDSIYSFSCWVHEGIIIKCARMTALVGSQIDDVVDRLTEYEHTKID